LVFADALALRIRRVTAMPGRMRDNRATGGRVCRVMSVHVARIARTASHLLVKAL
jgi:hypothetical protein